MDNVIYADPPYPGELRNGRMYRCEMMKWPEHERLLDVLLRHEGFVILSGYDNEVYNKKLKGWFKATKSGYANSSKPRIDTLWMNFEPQLRFEI